MIINKKAMITTYALVIIALIVIGVLCAEANKSPDIVRVAPTATPDQTPASTAVPSCTPAPVKWSGEFELPVNGATGYAIIDLNLRASPDAGADKLGTLNAGTAFTVAREDGNYWYTNYNGAYGYIDKRYSMINLPDILPSIVYENTNASASVIRTSGNPIAGITGYKLYDSFAYNPRFSEEEFVMPVMYSMAVKISNAQQTALRDGNCLKLYEAYRPFAAQRKVVDALNALAKIDADVMMGISASPWKVSWFASQGVSNHQRGCAIDVSLIEIVSSTTRVCGRYAYTDVTEYSEYSMPSAMHELSVRAVAFKSPVTAVSKTAWRSVKPSDSMNTAALTLQRYMTDAGLTPLASEWWHFNDLDARALIIERNVDTDIVLDKIKSIPPDN